MTTKKETNAKTAKNSPIEEAAAQIEAAYPIQEHPDQLRKHLIQDHGFGEEEVDEFLAERNAAQEKSGDK